MKSVLAIHIASGALAIVAGYAALFASKGERLHRTAGMLFVYSMILMGCGATVMALWTGKQSWLGGPFVAYLVITATTTVRRQEEATPLLDGTLMLVGAALGITFLLAGIQAATSPGGRLNGVPAPPIFMNAAVALLGAAGDARVLRNGPLRGNRRLARHLWRMCFALFVATGSFFLGQAKVIPEALRIRPLLIGLAVAPLVLLIYWRWHVRRRAPAYDWISPGSLEADRHAVTAAVPQEAMK